MKSRCFSRHRQKQKGIIIPLFAVGIFALLLLLGLVLDVSNLYHAQLRLQRAVDGAALASARLQHNPVDNDAQRILLEGRVRDVADAVVRKSLEAQKYESALYSVDPPQVNFPIQGLPPGNPPRGPYTVVRAQLSPDLYLLNLLPNFSSRPILAATAEAEARSAIISLVLDVSGSMDNYMGGQKKIDALKEAAKEFVMLLGTSRDMVALNTFSYSAEERVAANDYWDSTTVIRNQRNTLINTINGLNADGWTNSSEALFYGWQSIKDKVSAYPFLPCYVVFFTDGAPNHTSMNWVPSGSNTFGQPSLGSAAFIENQAPIDAGNHWYSYNATSVSPVSYENHWYRAKVTLNNRTTESYKFEPFCPGGGGDCVGPGNLHVIDAFGANRPVSFRVPGAEDANNIDGRFYQVFALQDRDNDGDDNDEENLMRLPYLTAIAMSDYIKFKGCTIFSIGLGRLESNFSSFYQTITDDQLPRKDYFLSRVANDPECGGVPQANPCRDLPAPNYGYETYAQLRGRNAPEGDYYPTDQPGELAAIFRDILANIRLRLNQ